VRHVSANSQVQAVLIEFVGRQSHVDPGKHVQQAPPAALRLRFRRGPVCSTGVRFAVGVCRGADAGAAPGGAMDVGPDVACLPGPPAGAGCGEPEVIASPSVSVPFLWQSGPRPQSKSVGDGPT
jgi:hypothetical protein